MDCKTGVGSGGKRQDSAIHPKLINRLSLDDFPIPKDARICDFWSPVLVDIADHIGAYAALLICDSYAGQEIYIPLDAKLSPFRGLITEQQTIVMAHVYGGVRLPMPTGSTAVHHAKRQGVVAAIRAGQVNVVQAAAALGMARRHLSRVVNQSDEGEGYEPLKLPEPRVLVALRMAASITAETLRSIGAPFDVVESTTTKILDIFFKAVSRRVGEDHDPSNATANLRLDSPISHSADLVSEAQNV